ncbi:hypothetical protein CO082_02310 [Candidatus Peregrinibacteria bacterium CG_4_9_14_0_8_um_filter_44_15]|nr:MAG: hypothetical protein AUK45_03170 [Candidatus Peregrinibacteria bacterium CG2_30_44_17]PJB89071.1 MAG: hypothetical protein CO082_02310 [Candidatus Peregrinibacteria bacterium CG_4_9_14_0_8_um_filter_44_15]
MQQPSDAPDDQSSDHMPLSDELLAKVNDAVDEFISALPEGPMPTWIRQALFLLVADFAKLLYSCRDSREIQQMLDAAIRSKISTIPDLDVDLFMLNAYRYFTTAYSYLE